MTELHLDSAADSGQCVGRLDGQVVFVRGGLPGETVLVELTQQKRRFARARLLQVDVPSPHRIPSDCAWFPACGGCAWRHTTAEEQLRIKADVLQSTLRKMGGVDMPVSVRSLGRRNGWRTRVTLQVDEHGRPGFHEVGSHDVVAVEHCLQAASALALEEILAQRWPDVDRVAVSVSQAGRSVIAGSRTFGPAGHHDTVFGRSFSRAVDGFWQSHVDAPQTLAGAVRELAEPVERVVDLYAGVGLFGLILLDAMPGASVTLVEGDRVAARHARRNAAGAARVLAVDVRRWRPEACDLVVLDPPRAGAGAQVVGHIVAAGPRTVIYVSCDAPTLARDLKTFATAGYRPDHIEGFDLFPATAHVETIVRLRRAT